jgi:integrase
MEWRDLQLDGRPHAIVRASVSKTRRLRPIPLEPNALNWFRFIQHAFGPPTARIMSEWTESRLARARSANWRAAAGAGTPYPQNALRKTFATNWMAAFDDYDGLASRLGHSSTVISFRHYAAGTSSSRALAYWQIQPPI